MDFFQHQERARRHTKLLVVYFVLAIIFMVGAIYAVCSLVFVHDLAWNPSLFLWVASGTLLIVCVGSLYKISALSRGGSAVAALLGGRPLESNTTDPDERKLLNVVEEMAIASGTPVPEVYLLSDEQSINAFAAGTAPGDAVVGVTRGCMKLLSRDELQGVIAHEFSHILNGDMRLNLRLMGLLNGILCVAIIGRVLLYSSSRRGYYRMGASSRGKGGNPLPLLGLALMAIGFIGVFFGRLIKSAVSRQREFLADASAVQFTRNPGGISGALKKIGGLVYGSRLQATHAEEASHLYFGNGLRSPWFSLLATHPPLAARIRAIEPNFDGEFPQVEAPPVEVNEPDAPPRVPPPLVRRSVPAPRLDDLMGQAALSAGFSVGAVDPARALSQTGAPTADHLALAAAIRDSIPATVADAIREPLGACAAIYGLLLSRDLAARGAQLSALQARMEGAVYEETLRLLSVMGTIHPRSRLPLAELALPALRHLSPAQYARFTQNLNFIIESDRQIDLFEYAVERMVLRHLAPHFGHSRKPVIQYYSWRPLLPDVQVLLSALAHHGSDERTAIQAAFAEGRKQLGREGENLSLLDKSEADLAQIDAALNRLAQASPSLKKMILGACAHTVAADGVIQSNEAELLRAIADSLDCPMPPLLTAGETAG